MKTPTEKEIKSVLFFKISTGNATQSIVQIVALVQKSREQLLESLLVSGFSS